MRRALPPRALAALVIAAGTLCTGCGPAAAGPHRPPPSPVAAEPAAPVVVGPDTVGVLVRGDAAFPVIRSLLAGAGRSVDLEMYELSDDALAAALIDAHRRGVAVRVIDDPSEASGGAVRGRLRAEGVAVVDYPVRRMMIDHVKLLVVDDAVAVVGGINWGARSAANHDFDAVLRGPVVANCVRVFARDLVASGRTGVEVPPAAPDPSVLVATTLPGAEIRPLALDLIEHARRRIDLQLYVLTDGAVVEALERAQRRGVAVRVLLDPGERPSDPAAARLSASGVPLRLHHGRGEKLHAKALVTDSRHVLFGSANWSGGGFARNHELDLEVVDSAAVAAPFLAALDADWAGADPPRAA